MTRTAIIVWSDRRACLFAALVVLGGLATACCSGGSTPASPSQNPGGQTKDETPPVLSVAFVATETAAAFYVFGAPLPSGVQNPTFEVETPDQTGLVFAASGGKVVNITLSTNGIDRAVTIVPSDASVWSIIYDHVSDVRVSIGQSVAAGATLGTVGILNNGRGRTELQVNRFDPSPTISYCPQTFGTATFNAAFTAAAQRLNGSPTVCTAATVRP
jgi:hypothetical protein